MMILKSFDVKKRKTEAYIVIELFIRPRHVIKYLGKHSFKLDSNTKHFRKEIQKINQDFKKRV